MLEADRAEQAGDLATATAALRRHLGVSPGDMAARLRYARLLMACGERAAARHELEVLDRGGPATDAVAPDANRLLAELDESEGALGRAALRWERLLALDIDDPQARAHLRRLRADEIQPPAEGAAGTLVSPDGVEMLRYRLVRELGRGGTSAVYLARDQVLDIPIALKVLHPQLAGPARSEARRRFFAEARLAAALRHPGVIAIYDLDEGARTLSMEYVPGGTLRTRLRQVAAADSGGRPSAGFDGAEILLDRAQPAGSAGPRARARHRARRPQAVESTAAPSGRRWSSPTSASPSSSAAPPRDVGGAPAGDAPGGTPLYLAPEQFAGAPASPATDLYAAGAIIWEMMMGRPLRDQSALIAGSQHDAAPVAPAADRAARRDRRDAGGAGRRAHSSSCC